MIVHIGSESQWIAPTSGVLFLYHARYTKLLRDCDAELIISPPKDDDPTKEKHITLVTNVPVRTIHKKKCYVNLCHPNLFSVFPVVTREMHLRNIYNIPRVPYFVKQGETLRTNDQIGLDTEFIPTVIPRTNEMLIISETKMPHMNGILLYFHDSVPKFTMLHSTWNFKFYRPTGPKTKHVWEETTKYLALVARSPYDTTQELPNMRKVYYTFKS